jgi:O-acetyl-ADP-ribose deacetylase (regulator of RNase III)
MFDSSCDYLTNTINTVGAMGAGIALEFRLRVPEMYAIYKEKCNRREIDIGQYWIYDRPNRMRKKILNFPVKKGFNHPSKWEYIIEGLRYFVQNYEKDNITSIAMPTLGARLGKLDNEGVMIVMQEELRDLPIRIEIYSNYETDLFTKRVKNIIGEMSIYEISKEVGLPLPKSEQLKRQVSEAFFLPDLVTFHKTSVNIVQKLYDFGYRRSANARLG